MKTPDRRRTAVAHQAQKTASEGSILVLVLPKTHQQGFSNYFSYSLSAHSG